MTGRQARLLTIPISHFCEKARWALDRAGMPYEERPHLQFVHIAASRLAGGRGSVPVLITSEREVLADSTDILRWTDQGLPPEGRLYPDGPAGATAAELEEWMDEGLGPDGRLWLYHETLSDIGRLRPWALAGVPGWERIVFDVTRPGIGLALRRYLSVDARAARDSLERVERVFDDVQEHLSDGRPYLAGDRFTAADLTFAALSAPVLVPERYGSPLPPVEEMPGPAAAVVRRLRDHPAGRFAARMYTEHRARVELA